MKRPVRIYINKLEGYTEREYREMRKRIKATEKEGEDFKPDMDREW